jgi:hypothetical protein
MRTLLRIGGFTVLVVIVLSLTVGSSAAGAIGVAGLLVAVLATAVSGARPQTGRGKQQHARSSLGFLSRYSSVDEPGSLASIVLTAWAVSQILGVIGGPGLQGRGAGLLAAALAYVAFTRVAAQVLGLLAALVSAIQLVSHLGGCGEPLSAGGLAAFAVAVLAATAMLIATRRGLLSRFGRVRGSAGPDTWALLLFGMLELTAFILHPAGVDLYELTSFGQQAAALGLLVVIAMFAGFAPGLVLGLVAIGLTVGELTLAAVAGGSALSGGSDCGAFADVGTAVAFAIVVLIGLRIRRR